MIYLSQQDPRWANVRLGNSRFNISRYGCTTTCISMLSDYFGCFTPPDQLAQNVIKYTMDGLILWPSVQLEHMQFEIRGYGRDDQFIQAALKDPSRAVILNVNNGAHWVVALSKTIFGNDYNIADPWDGKKKTASVYKNIVGYATFKIK